MIDPYKSSYWEPPGEDPIELHIAEAELFINMTPENVAASAAELGMSVAEYEQWRQKKIGRYRSVNEDDLTPDQYRRLFGEDRELVPTLLTGMTEARWRSLTDEERDEAAAELEMCRDVLDASFEDLAADWAWLEELDRRLSRGEEWP